MKPAPNSKGKAVLEQPMQFSKVANVHLGPDASSQPTFNSFSEWLMAGIGLQAPQRLLEHTTVKWNLTSKSMSAEPMTVYSTCQIAHLG